MTKYAIQKKKEYHTQSTECITIASSANVTVVGSLKDSIAALIPGAHTSEADSFDYSFSHMCRGELNVKLDLGFDIQYEQKRTGIIRKTREESILQCDKRITSSRSSFFHPEKQTQSGLLEEASITILIIAANDPDENKLLCEKYSSQLRAADAAILLQRGMGTFSLGGCKYTYGIHTHETNVNIIAKELADKVENIVEEKVNALIEQSVEKRKLDFITTKEAEIMGEIHHDADDYFATSSSCFLCR